MNRHGSVFHYSTITIKPPKDFFRFWKINYPKLMLKWRDIWRPLLHIFNINLWTRTSKFVAKFKADSLILAIGRIVGTDRQTDMPRLIEKFETVQDHINFIRPLKYPAGFYKHFEKVNICQLFDVGHNNGDVLEL